MAKKKTTLAKALTSLTNAELLDLAREYSPTFASHTAQATNEWLQISLLVYLFLNQKVKDLGLDKKEKGE